MAPENDEEITLSISDKDQHLRGILRIPENAKGIILFVHGRGSSRLSPRNRFVAQELTMLALRRCCLTY